MPTARDAGEKRHSGKQFTTEGGLSLKADTPPEGEVA